MSYAVKLAKELKNRNNKDKIGIIIGIVVSVDPLKISIYNDEILLTSDSLYVCKNATDYTMEVTTDTGKYIAKHEGLKINDRVAVMATEDNQKFFVIDSLV